MGLEILTAVEREILTAGERWAREQLELLRAARFSPQATACFLMRSQCRANNTRRLRPELRRQEIRWAAVGGVLWAGLAALDVAPFRRRLRAGLTWWGLTALMLDWHLGMLETEDGRPRKLAAADAATLLRAWLVPAVAEGASPGLCAIGFAADVIDGPLARASEPTRFGRDLEGLVDAAFVAAAVSGARRHGLISSRVAAVELARLSAGFAYAIAIYFGRAQAPDRGLLRAARLSTPLRAAGIVAAGAGHCGSGRALLLAGSGLGVAGLARAWRQSGRPAT